MQQRGKVARIDRDRLLKRVTLRGIVAKLALRERNIDPQRGARRIKRSSTLQQASSAARVSAHKGPHASDVKHPRMIGRQLARTSERTLRRGAVSSLIGPVHRV